MSVRSVLSTATTAATAALVALTLTACDPAGDTSTGAGDARAAGTTAAGTPAATGSPQAPAKSSAKPSGAASQGGDPAEPGMDCGAAPKLAAGHRMLNVSKASTATAFHAKETTFECDPNDGHWADAGAEKTYSFAAGAVVELTDLSFQTKKVTLAQLAEHTAKCLDHTEDPEKRPCFSNLTYEVVLDASGKITKATEKFHS
ncbi:hypothetical protein OG871_20330 [Kitasatospora sp. NBC_00374]|uniref:hypothetical protein n=1 Tax=Kitasatospora sp. NBC_00374 TaxID=2975964 RepID=UPI0030E0C11B